MSSQNNPLQKYFRQPKIFVGLPSKGLFYTAESLQGDHNNMPVYGMTGMDEILLKTPDALFNGESTIKVIESCCPYIKDAGEVPSIDIDFLLVAIRIATYGDELDVTTVCEKCSAENEFTIQLQTALDYFNFQNYDGKIVIGPITINIRPLKYSEISEYNLENFKLQKMLFQINQSSNENDEESVKKLQTEVFSKISQIQLTLFITSIENITVDGQTVEDKAMIAEWLANCDKDFFQEIKKRIEKSRDQWSLPKQHVKCSSCGHESDIDVTLDPSNFFGKS